MDKTSTIVLDEYHCVECDKKVPEKGKLKTCAYCHVMICSECYRKHNHLCIWCYQNVDFQYVKQKQLILKLLPIILALIFLLPVPIPLIILIIKNPVIILRTIPFIVGFVLIYIIYRSILSRKIITSIPDHPEWKNQKTPLIIEDDVQSTGKNQISKITENTAQNKPESNNIPPDIKSTDQVTMKIETQIPADAKGNNLNIATTEISLRMEPNVEVTQQEMKSSQLLADTGGKDINSLGAEIALPMEQDDKILEPINKELQSLVDTNGKDSGSVGGDIPPPIEPTVMIKTINNVPHRDNDHNEMTEDLRIENPDTFFNDILIPLSISASEGLNGCKKEITFRHPYSNKWDKISVDVPPNTRGDYSNIIEGKGLPSYDLTEIGNIIIQIHIQ